MGAQTLRIFTIGVVIFSACSDSRIIRTSSYSNQNVLDSVVNAVTIEGVPEAVFDLITTARFWPQWHPATMAVSGVTERPYLLGDHIIEQGRIGAGEFKVRWEVAEHVRPRRVVLQAGASPAQITYSFNSRGNVTEFKRQLKYSIEELTSISPDPNEVNRLMRVQSEQAVTQLKALVEKILRDERLGTAALRKPTERESEAEITVLLRSSSSPMSPILRLFSALHREKLTSR